MVLWPPTVQDSHGGHAIWNLFARFEHMATYGPNRYERYAIQCRLASSEPVATYGIDGYGITCTLWIAIVQACTLSTHNSNLVQPHVFYMNLWLHVLEVHVWSRQLQNYGHMDTFCGQHWLGIYICLYTISTQYSHMSSMSLGTYGTCFGIMMVTDTY